MNENNLYVILNVPRTATHEEIKKSYKKLAVKTHPDKHMNKSNHEEYKNKFIKLKDAFDTLSDENKRQQYDKSIYNYADDMVLKKKSKNILDFIKNPAFYLLFFDNIMCSNFSFIGNFLENGNVFKILDITKNIKFTLHEYYNNIPKLMAYERLTRDLFVENIFAIDNTQIYEKDGELINIDDTIHYGNFIVNIEIINMTHKNKKYHIIENDLYLFIKKGKNKIKLKFLDNKNYVFKINKLNKLESNNSDSSEVYYIKNMGLPYFDTKNNEINNINLLNIKRGKLFFILII